MDVTQHFMWFCMHNAIPTNKLRYHYNLATSPVCQQCGKYDEDVLHYLGDIGFGGLLRDNKGNWIAGFSSNDGQGDALFAELFGVYHGLMLVINNSIQQIICETYSLEVFRLLQDLDHSHMHVYASLLVKIFGLKEHICNISLQHVLREGNHCADFLAKLGSSSRLGVTFWHAPPSELKSVLRLVAPGWALFLGFFFFFCHFTKKKKISYLLQFFNI